MLSERQLMQAGRIVLLGYGCEGKSVERYLRMRRYKGEVVTADEKDGPGYLSKQDGADAVVCSPGVTRDKVTRPYTTATNLFFAACPYRVVGVTGTKGKSTTASLIASILREAGRPVKLVGNIGVPALDILSEKLDPETVVVYELSSYQLEDCEYSPSIAVLVSLFPEHMDHHGSIEAYLHSKQRIVIHQKAEDDFVYGQLKTELRDEWLRIAPSRTHAVTEDFPFKQSDIPLVGEHNRHNIRVALTVARLLGIPDELSEKALYAFKPLPHRLAYVGTYRGIVFYDDAISTTPESTICALRSIAGVTTLFLGGKDRGYDFTELAHVIEELGIPHIVLFPDSGARIKEALLQCKTPPSDIREMKTMEDAVRFAYEVTDPGGVCLLSTASPSYSLWSNFVEKGTQFQQCVRKGVI